MSLESLFRLSVIINMIDNVSKPVGKATDEMTKFEKTASNLTNASANFAKAGTGIAVAGYAMTKGLLSTVEATYETKAALGEVASLGVKELNALEREATKFSNTFAGTNKADFIAAAYDIKSGISSLSDAGVAEFTRLSALTGKATKSTVGDMTNLFAKGYSIYKSAYADMTDQQFGEMFSGAIAKAVQQYRTKGSEMSAAISALGATASTAKVPMEEQLAILGMLQQTMSGSEAATKYKEFIKSAAGAGKALKISFVDANNQLLTMPEILTKLKSKYGDTVDAVEKMEIQKAFGTAEAVAVVDLLYGSVGNLTDNITGMGDAMKTGTKLTEDMAKAMDAGNPGAKWAVMDQKIQNLKETIGDKLAPTVAPLIEDISNLALKMGEWVDKNPELASGLLKVAFWASIILTTIGLTVGGIGLLGVVIGNIMIGFGNFATFAGFAKSGMLAFRGATLTNIASLKAFGLSSLATGKSLGIGLFSGLAKASMATWSFTAALLANPVTWIVIGIVALIAALILLWKNWDVVSAFLNKTWKSVTEWVSQGIDNLTNKLKNFFKGIGDGWNAVKGFFGFGDKTSVSVKNTAVTQSNGSRYLGSFATGLHFVPADGWANIHYGERIMTARENAEYSKAKAGSGKVKEFISSMVQTNSNSKSEYTPVYADISMNVDSSTSAKNFLDELVSEARRRTKRKPRR